MAIVIFNPTSFKAVYPQFASVSDSVLQNCFDQAGLYLSNTDTSPVQNIARRTLLLNMLTAHIGTLNGVATAGVGPLPVGRTASASEGSVSASFDYGTPGSAPWFAQTQYGAAFWQATSSLRGFRYLPRPTLY